MMPLCGLCWSAEIWIESVSGRDIGDLNRAAHERVKECRIVSGVMLSYDP